MRNVRQTGPNRWLASCPAHEDKHPSFGVSVGDQGQILFLCRSGCDQQDVLDVMGLTFRDLYPEPINRIPLADYRKAFPAADVLEALADEANLVAVAAQNIAAGVELTQQDLERLIVASNRIYNATRLALGKRR